MFAQNKDVRDLIKSTFFIEIKGVGEGGKDF